MGEIINNNIKFLSSNFPIILKKLYSVNISRKFSYREVPIPNIYFNNKPLHSKLNPENEALNLIKDINLKDGHIYLFMGIGLAYHIEIFKKLYKDRLKNITIIAIEKNLDVFKLLVNNKDISFLEDIKLFIGEDIETIKNVFNRFSPLAFKGYKIIKLRGDVSLDKDYYSKLENYFKSILSVKLSDILTHLAFENLWIKNIISNIPFISGKRSISSLKNSLKNKPALVICAGPSLYNQLNAIKKISQKIYTIAVDTVLEPLIISKIKPDFVVTLDSQFYNIYDFIYTFTNSSFNKDTYLIADLLVYPKILKNWKGEIFLSESVNNSADEKSYNSEHPLVSILKKYVSSFASLSCGGSVATTAVEFAIFLGADPIFITGLDLSYTNYTTHINSSPQYTKQYMESNRLQTLNTSMIKSIKDRRLKELEGIDGKNVLSDFVFQNYLNWIESRKNYRGRVFNLTHKGVNISSVEHLNIKELLKLTEDIDKKKALTPINSNIFTKNTLLKFLIDLKKSLLNAKEELKNNKVTFSFLNKFMGDYKYLQNNIIELTSLYKNLDFINDNLFMLLNFLENEIEKSIKKINR